MSASTDTAKRNQGVDAYDKSEWDRRLELAACYRLADRFGFSDIVWSHITACVPGSDKHFLLNRFGLRYDEVTASNLIKLDLEGNVLDGPNDVNVTGFVIHSAVHAAREDVVCVMHAHPPGGLAVSALKGGLIPMIQDAMPFYNRVAYHDYEGISIDTDECQRLAANLGTHNAMIMRNHGLLTVGRTVGEAFMLMYSLERACRVQMQVLASGQEVSLPSSEICEQAAKQYEGFWPGKHEWPALVRLLDAEEPSYQD